jgi:hypothetical protein
MGGCVLPGFGVLVFIFSRSDFTQRTAIGSQPKRNHIAASRRKKPMAPPRCESTPSPTRTMPSGTRQNGPSRRISAHAPSASPARTSTTPLALSHAEIGETLRNSSTTDCPAWTTGAV